MIKVRVRVTGTIMVNTTPGTSVEKNFPSRPRMYQYGHSLLYLRLSTHTYPDSHSHSRIAYPSNYTSVELLLLTFRGHLHMY